MDNLHHWDSCKDKIYPTYSAPKKGKSGESFYEKNDDKILAAIAQAINIGIVSFVNQAADSPSLRLYSKSSAEHLCFMLENFNTIISIMDIVLSVGFTSLKMLCSIE